MKSEDKSQDLNKTETATTIGGEIGNGQIVQILAVHRKQSILDMNFILKRESARGPPFSYRTTPLKKKIFPLFLLQTIGLN